MILLYYNRILFYITYSLPKMYESEIDIQLNELTFYFTRPPAIHFSETIATEKS